MDTSEQIRQLSRNLIREHGELLEARCLSDPPHCRIELVFADGHEIIVTKHSGHIDVTTLKFGYYGAGPQCFHSFLNEAGLKISYQEIAEIKAPRILRQGAPFDFTEGSIAREALLTKGFIACELAQYAKARACYARAGELYPGDSLAWFNLGVVEYRSGNFDAALDAFKRVITLKEYLVDGAFWQALCLQKLGRPLEWPPEYAENPSVIGVEGPIRNLAHELQNRGYVIAVKAEGEHCALETTAEQVKYTVTLYDLLGQLLGNIYREEGGKSVSIIDRSGYPNPTEVDKEFLLVGTKLSSRRPAQMPVGPGVMPEERYAELSKAADLRAITQEHGPHSWTRHGYTYEEKDAKKSAEMGPNWKYMRVFSYADLVKENESNTFTVCAFEGKPHLVAKVQIPPEDIPKLRSTIEAGKKVSIDAAIEKFQTTRSIILRTSCYAYPTYPVIYNRALIVVDFGPRPNSIKGILVESATNFTEANFQEWAITLQRTQSMSIHVYSSTGEHLASGDTQIDPEIVSMVINAIDQADTLFKKIPEELRNFKEATQEFFRDHPEPFLFEKTPKEDTQHRI